MEIEQLYIALLPSVGLTCRSRMVNMFCPMPFHSDKVKGNISFFRFSLFEIHGGTDQPKKKALFSRFAAEHPLREIIFSWRKIKITYFAEDFLCEISRFLGVRETPRHFAEKLRDISRRHSAKFRGDTSRNFAMGR